MPDYTRCITLANQQALTTGASRGLGADIAAVFDDAGVDLALLLASPAANCICGQGLRIEGGLPRSEDCAWLKDQS